MPFFDFHCHPGIKPQFSKPDEKPTPWEFLSAKLAVFKDAKISINKLFNEVLNSQSNLTQLIEADVKLIGIILHAPEQAIGQVLSEKKIVNKGSVNLINKEQLTYIAAGTHSFELINAELSWLLNAPAPPGKKLTVINKSSDFNDSTVNTIYAAIIIEGLHCFFNTPDDDAAFTGNFNSFTSSHAVVAINLCHMQQNKFCNHAFGIQLFNPQLFFPVQKGISSHGWQVIDMMIEKNILVDVKHMSLLARKQLYVNFNEAGSDEFKQPIICTHAGTTGISMADCVKYIFKKPQELANVYKIAYLKPKSRHDEGTYHNCSSINLYDEDIQFILRSGGIIGLSFDQRILGFADENVLTNVTTPHDVEYISKQEATSFLGPNPQGLPLWTDDNKVWTSEDFDNLDPSLYVDVHRRFLVNNIIHILWVAANTPGIGAAKAAKQICIGTDFDGLINAIDCCKDCTDLPQLKEDIKDGLVNLIELHGLDSELSNIDQLLDDIFYNNGKNFILNRLKIISGF
jgi:microsomal dipeptidase-like Zn-dependent dipeptidase